VAIISIVGRYFVIVNINHRKWPIDKLKEGLYNLRDPSRFDHSLALVQSFMIDKRAIKLLSIAGLLSFISATTIKQEGI